MNLYQSLIFPVFKRMDPERAHDWTSKSLQFAQSMAPGRAVLRTLAGKIPDRKVKFCGLTFQNVIGIAAGFDKDVHVSEGLACLGFGHIEVGTLTPRPQPGNPKPRVFRLPPDRAIINRMGFPNGGVDAALPRLQRLANRDREFVLGVSLGKQKETPLADAAGDYIAVMRKVYTSADYLAVNISSPNTPGLRELQGGGYLGKLLGALVQEGNELAEREKVSRRPILVKIAPDLTDEELDEILEAVQSSQIDGMIATNTTIGREGATHPNAKETGGLSGEPVREKSTRIIARIHDRTGGRVPIIGVGGISSAADAREKLDAGASLLQVYTGLVYEGPCMAGRLLRDLATG